MSTMFSGRSYINYNEAGLIAALKDLDWEPMYNENDPNVAGDIMKTVERPLDHE